MSTEKEYVKVQLKRTSTLDFIIEIDCEEINNLDRIIDEAKDYYKETEYTEEDIDITEAMPITECKFKALKKGGTKVYEPEN